MQDWVLGSPLACGTLCQKVEGQVLGYTILFEEIVTRYLL